MARSMSQRRRRLVGLSVIIALILAAGSATVALGQAPQTTVYACLNTRTHTLFNVSTTSQRFCGSSATAVSWTSAAPSGSFIDNGTTLQTNANFNIDGSGQVGGNFSVGGNLSATGSINSAVGYQLGGTTALMDNASFGNLFVGPFSGTATTPLGVHNTGVGQSTLASNTSGQENTATGNLALRSNTTGDANTGTGVRALVSNTIGDSNTATGREALQANTTGNRNTGSGVDALSGNLTGNENTGTGFGALFTIESGSDNTAVGFLAGADTEADSSNNTFLGANAGTAASSGVERSTAIGANAKVTESDAVVLGDATNSNTKVGIGTTAPQSTLDVRGTIATSKGVQFGDGTTQTTAAPRVVSGTVAKDASQIIMNPAGAATVSYDSTTHEYTLTFATAALDPSGPQPTIVAMPVGALVQAAGVFIPSGAWQISIVFETPAGNPTQAAFSFTVTQ